jgi:hypothetical protein
VGTLEAYEISPAVNRHDNDGPQLIEPASAQAPQPAEAQAKPARKPKKDERQSSLF